MRHDTNRPPVRRRRLAVFGLSGALVLAACAGSGDDEGSASTPPATSDESTSDESSDRVLSGVVREPSPSVDVAPLPSLTDPGTEVEFRAQPGGIQVVYFGFTNCPDVCPTTMSDYRAALNRLDRDDPGRTDMIDTVVVTVDPARDLNLLPQYAAAFVPDAVAAGTMDDDLLMEVAEPFGVSYDVRTLDDGTIEVDHSPFLYAVDDQGKLVLTWQFGATPSDIASDLGILLESAVA